MSSPDFPEIATPRLVLRQHKREDFPLIRDIWANESVGRYTGGAPRSEEEVWTKFLRKIGHWALLGFGYWTLEEKATGALVGELGFGDFKREITPSLIGEAEIGWVIAPHAQGKGYASEAALAAVAWGDANIPQMRMSCIIEPANVASIRIAEKCGFSKTCATTYHGSEILVFHRG